MTSNIYPSLNQNDSTLKDLTDDLNDIYNSYTMKSSSLETLDSRRIETGSHSPYPSYINRNLPEVHISSHLSSLAISDEDKIVKSAPVTPKSGSEFDFRPRRTYSTHAATNSSLNVLLDSPSGEQNFENLKEEILTSDDDGIPASREMAQDKEDWAKRGEATKVIKDGEDVKIIRRTVNDFKFGKPLGEGSYSTVVLATDKRTSKQYAVKILDKRHIIKEKKVKYVNIEKNSLNRLRNRTGIISLYFTFQDKDSLYFVLDYASNGELLTLIKNYGSLNQECTRHFGAQILDAIKYMHDNGVIHRDIKPENILLDDKMRIQITDFGTARLLEKKDSESEEYPFDVRAKSFVGTAEYVSPELLESKYCGKPGDIWAFGCILYQMIAGKPPFKAANEYLTFQKITKLQYAFSAGFPSVLRDLIKKILVLQPSRRATIPDIQKHYFFQDVNFDDVDTIWESEVPELGPYRMSAESMMKIPELNKTSSAASAVPRKKQPPVKRLSNNTDINTANGGLSEKPSNGNKSNLGPVDAVSVAAFVLNKSQVPDLPQAEEDKSSTPTESIEKQKRKPQPDYIPGTNILRPQLSSRRSFSRSTVSSARQKRASPTSLKPKSRILEVTPVTALEEAWASYLNHPDERILRIGPVIVHKELTETFEKKHKGMLHASPLDVSNKKSRTTTSLLTQMATGQHTSNNGYRNESVAIFDHYDLAENGLKRSGSKRDSKSGSSRDDSSLSGSTKISRSSLFRKFGFIHADSKNESSSAKPHDLLDRPQTCTLIVTTHGRALIFYKPQEESLSYKLVLEIKLKYPFIHFQELVSSKYHKSVPTTGIFVISSIQTSFICEVESSEIIQWTESLTKAKVNELHRLSEIQDVSSPREATSPVRENTSPKAPQSPKLIHSSPQQPTPRRSPDLNAVHRRSSHDVKRRPIAPAVTSSPELNIHTGLPTKSDESGWLHAAQLAVSHNSPTPPTNNRRTSFQREDPTRAHVIKASPNSAGSAGITSLNSKLLARSQRKK